MKNIFRILMAAAVLLTASCAKEDISSSIGGGEVEMTFTVDLQNLGSRAYGDGSLVKTLHYYVYDSSNNELSDLNGTADRVNDQFKFNLPLLKGMTYSIVFWADCGTGSIYSYNPTAKTITANYNGVLSNNENLDAFYKCVTNIDPTASNIQEKTTVVLTRPFAQLNTLTKDYAAIANNEVELKKSKIVGVIPTTLNVLDGTIVTPTEEVTLGFNDLPTDEDTTDDLTPLSMNYILAPATQKFVADITFYYEGSINFPSATYTNIPLQRNYRTNIIGKLLTASTEFTVTIENEFTADDKYGILDGKTYIRVENAEEFNAAFVDGLYDMIILEENIVLDSSLTRAADPVLTVSEDKELTIDLNNFTLSSTSTQSGKNYNMFDVRGTLTVKNGTIEYQHTGDNMAWNNFAEIFYVGFNGTLNLDGVTAKNLGGSDMAYVVDMVNATNINVNINNSTLETPYIPIRVFNNSKSGVNNVTIKNSTLTGKYCFWVQYWLADGRDEATLSQTLKLDIYNSEEGKSNSNTFNFNNQYDAPVLYGFDEAVYYDQYGNEIPAFIPILDAEGNEVAGIAYDPASATEVEGETVYTTIVVTDDPGLTWVAANIVANDGFAGKTIRLEADVDLEGIKTNGETFAPIGVRSGNDKPFKGTFDGNGKTISNLNQSGWDLGYQWGAFGGLGLFGTVEDATIKNLTIKDMVSRVEGGEIGAIAACAKGDCTFENITIESGDLGTYNNGLGGIVGYTEGGHFVFKDITIGEDVLLGGLWGSFDSSVGGIVGQADANSSYHFEDVEINCRVDAYNDVTAAYKYYAYRMCGMIIGWVPKTQNDNGTTRPDPAANNVTCKNVTVNYGAWMNYTYCDNCYKRLEPGYEYGGHTCDNPEHTHTVRPFDQIFGGGQYGVYGLAAYDGVTVNYPASYTPEE